MPVLGLELGLAVATILDGTTISLEYLHKLDTRSTDASLANWTDNKVLWIGTLVLKMNHK